MPLMAQLNGRQSQGLTIETPKSYATFGVSNTLRNKNHSSAVELICKLYPSQSTHVSNPSGARTENLTAVQRVIVNAGLLQPRTPFLDSTDIHRQDIS